ncbi:unnamed protein product, partial [Discosporangium mesarthrocarpum]
DKAGGYTSDDEEWATIYGGAFMAREGPTAHRRTCDTTNGSTPGASAPNGFVRPPLFPSPDGAGGEAGAGTQAEARQETEALEGMEEHTKAENGEVSGSREAGAGTG